MSKLDPRLYIPCLWWPFITLWLWKAKEFEHFFVECATAELLLSQYHSRIKHWHKWVTGYLVQEIPAFHVRNIGYCVPDFLFSLVLEQWWPKDTPFVSELDLWEANERIVEQALILQYAAPKWKLPHCIFSYNLENLVSKLNCVSALRIPCTAVFKSLIVSKFDVYLLDFQYSWKWIPYTRHYNPLLIWNRSGL